MRATLSFCILFLSLHPAQAAENPAHRNAGIFFGAPQASAREWREETFATPPEFAPATELQMTAETFRRMQSELVGTVENGADLVVLVRSSSEARSLLNSWKQKGGSESRFKPMVISHDSFWYQDYGPFYSLDGSGALVSNDFTYNRYNRRNDDLVPERLASAQGLRNRKVSMAYEGGNFISDGKGRCFATSRIYQQNPQLSKEEVNRLMEANLGCRDLVVLASMVDDITFHIDLFAKMVNDHTFIVGDFVDHPRNREIVNRNAATLQALGYQVHRIPVRSPGSMDYRTHANAFLLNGYVLLPNYGIPEDREAAALYEKLGFRVVNIDVSDLTGSGGAVHCILRSKPRP